MRLGAIIVTKDRPAALQQTLSALTEQVSRNPWRRLRIIVYDNRSAHQNHTENKQILALVGGGEDTIEVEYERNLLPRHCASTYWQHALDHHSHDLDVLAFLPDTCHVDPTWWDKLSAPLRSPKVHWTWGKVEAWRDGKIAKRWGGALDISQLRYNNYIHLAGALFRADRLRKAGDLTTHDLATYHYHHDLVLRAATHMKGEHVPDVVAIDNPQEPYPEEALQEMHPNEQRVYTGWWDRHKDNISEVGSSRSS